MVEQPLFLFDNQKTVVGKQFKMSLISSPFSKLFMVEGSLSQVGFVDAPIERQGWRTYYAPRY